VIEKQERFCAGIFDLPGDIPDWNRRKLRCLFFSHQVSIAKEKEKVLE
jgi:hypothetical protein